MFTAEFSHDVAADPSTIWQLYADVKRWPAWSTDLQHVDLTGEFATGSKGAMHFKDGQRIAIELHEVKNRESFVDVAQLGPHAVRFLHVISSIAAGKSKVTHRISVEGPEAEAVGQGISSDVPQSLQNLAALAEAQVLGLITLYVDDVHQTASFFEKAFGLLVRMKSPDGGYVEFEGAVPLCLVSKTFAMNSTGGQPISTGAIVGSVGFLKHDVKAAWQRAMNAGAKSVHEPVLKPWGQTVAHLLTPQGILVELCTPWR